MATQEEDVKVEDIPEDFIRCPVCQERFRSPKYLTCLHSFCTDCLEQSLAESGVSDGQAFLCPICHSECWVPRKGVSALPANVLVESLLEFLARKATPPKEKEKPQWPCTGCEDGFVAVVKCIECEDWLCEQCVSLHKRVKITRTHNLFSVEELEAGQADDLLRDCFEPLICAKHDQSLTVYCVECQVPICRDCRDEHAGHVTADLAQQARDDAQRLEGLMGPAQSTVDALNERLQNIRVEDKMTSQGRKEIHKAINMRMEKVVSDTIKRIGKFAEQLHEQVETTSREHKERLAAQLDETKHRIEAAGSALTFTHSLLSFGRGEEIVTLGRQAASRLESFGLVEKEAVPAWQQPRLHPASAATHAELAKLFGELTVEGELVQATEINRVFTRVEGDERTPSLSDVAISAENDVLVLDKDNARLKVFDSQGQMLFSSEPGHLGSASRLAIFRSNGNALIKDDRMLRVVEQDGYVCATFAATLRHPVGLGNNRLGQIVITDWMTGRVYFFTEDGREVSSFPTATEAPTYVACAPDGSMVAVTDWKHNVLRVFENNGKLLWQYGSEGTGNGQFNHPYGIAIDTHGYVLVADSWNHRVHLISRDGKFVKFVVCADDGLNLPHAIAIDRDGLLVVAESSGNLKTFQYLA